MTPGGTTNRVMLRILGGMKEEELIPLPRLAEKIEMSESNVRRAMHDMQELGLVIQQPLPRKAHQEYDRPFHKSCSMGWRKTRIVMI